MLRVCPSRPVAPWPSRPTGLEADFDPLSFLYLAQQDPSTLIATSTALRSHPNYLRPEIYGTSVSPSITSGPAAKAAKASTSAAVTAPAVKGKGKDTVAAATVPKAKLVAGRLDFSKNQSKEQKDEKKVVDDKAKVSPAVYCRILQSSD